MEAIENLKNIIEEKLSSHFKNQEIVLLDAPYYENVGDILIYEGELSFLKNNNAKIHQVSSYNTFAFDTKLDEQIIIAINGGGNYGDLYSEHISFLKKIAKTYPNNKIIVFPQTIFYKNIDIAISDFLELKKHPNIIICARDKKGLELLNKHYIKEKSLLLPDMAFCIDMECFDLSNLISKNNILYIQRKDVEKVKDFHIDDHGCVISDWPSFQYSIRAESFIAKVLNNLYDKISLKVVRHLLNVIWDKYFNIHRKLMIKEGLAFIQPFKIIHTTRLHGAILAILLGKEVHIYNNSYGKNWEFYNSWLTNIPNVFWENDLKK